IDTPDAPPFFTIEVSARSGPAGLVRPRDPPPVLVARGIYLFLPENPGKEGIIIAQNSHNPGGLFSGGRIHLPSVRDNGNTDDQVVFFPIFSNPTCGGRGFPTLSFTLLHGNIHVTP